MLAMMAAVGRGDEGAGLHLLARHAGLDAKPAMSIVVKRNRPAKVQTRRTSLREWTDEDRYAYLKDDFAGMLIAV
jgi:hypothetical protein